MFLGIRADADLADYFTIHNDRKRALHFDETTRSRGRDATTVDSILKILARLLEQGRGRHRRSLVRVCGAGVSRYDSMMPPGMAISARIFLVELRNGESMSTIAFFGFLELRS
jgi:hypothetical protein